MIHSLTLGGNNTKLRKSENKKNINMTYLAKQSHLQLNMKREYTRKEQIEGKK